MKENKQRRKALREGAVIRSARDRCIATELCDITDLIVPRPPAIDATLAEALEDVRAGRVAPALGNTEELEACFETDEGKRFGA